jgi:hypothetical protein
MAITRKITMTETPDAHKWAIVARRPFTWAGRSRSATKTSR